MKGRFFLIFFIPVFLFSFDKTTVKLVDQFYLDQKRECLALPGDMTIDEQENIFVTDSKLCNVKIYNKKGSLIKRFGRKGGGPEEFLAPYTIDYDGDKLCVQDVELSKYLIFNKDLKEIKRFFYLVDGHDFVLQGNRIISNDYFMDEKKGNDFRGVILDFSGKVIKALMPIPYSKDDAWNRVTNSKSFVDVSQNGDIYFVKEKEVKFFKFSKKGEFLKNFGKNPPYFNPCQKTRDFEHAIFSFDPDRGRAWERWRSSFSWVSGIFVLEDLLGIAIRNFNKKANKWECFLQFYDLNGNLLEEGLKLKEVGTSSDTGFFMDSNHKDRIYILETTEDEVPQYRFFKYKVERK